MTNNSLVSDCCGAAPKSNGDSDSVEMGICPSCNEPCEYVDYEPPEPDYNGTTEAERSWQMANWQKLK